MRHAASLASQRNGEDSGTLESGGWCLTAAARNAKLHDYSWVELPNAQSYFLPEPHLAADKPIVKYLDALLRGCESALLQANQCDRPAGLYSVSDFGAGVGQYGHALRSMDLQHRWAGYDGAGNVEGVTGGMVRFFDLTLPLSLPRADWVLSLEVGEHIPPEHEMMYIRNLHAHACRGLVLSWAYLGKWGVGHVNTHSDKYLRSKILPLGYELDADATTFLRTVERPMRNPKMELHRRNVSSAWYWLRSVSVFRRIVPLEAEGCSPGVLAPILTH